METFRLANKGLEGEPEQLCFQNPETLKIYNLEDIDRIYINGGFRDFQPEDVVHVFHNEGHLVRIDETGTGSVVLYV